MKESSAKFIKERLPRDISFSIEESTLHIRLCRQSLIDDMQKAPCAFEGWALCLKSNYPEQIKNIVLDWEPIEFSSLTDKEKGHYYRSLYRIYKFKTNYPSWVTLSNEPGKEFIAELSNWVMNSPTKDSTESRKSNKEAEAHLERELLEILKNNKCFEVFDHQLPVGLFLDKVSMCTARASGKNSQIDLWAYKDESLFIFELKNKKNVSVGILSELLFYTNVISDLVAGIFTYPSGGSDFRSCADLVRLIQSKKIKSIQGIFLADNLHPFITSSTLALLKENKNKVRYRWMTVSDFKWAVTNAPIQKEYVDRERKRQTALYYKNKNTLWDAAENMGGYNTCKGKTVVKTDYYQFVLQHKDGDKNLYRGIRQEVKSYFSEHGIHWWREEEDGYAPNGHLLSSQNHCLNHLFSLRTDDISVLKMINSIQNTVRFEKVLPVPIDGDETGYIAFEFVYKNKSLLGESHETRGCNCTSIDAIVYAEDIYHKRWLLPIEWKYTENYDLFKVEYIGSISHYRQRIQENSNLHGWKEIYESNPMYELARQTLLVEHIINDDKEILADDYMHILVIPNQNINLRSMINDLYLPTLRDIKKVCIVSPEELLRGINSPHISYLEKRYW